MPAGYYRKLPREMSREPRIFEVALRAIETLSSFEVESVREFYEEVQRQRVLTLAELWAIRPTLKIALLKRLDATLATGPLESTACEDTVRRSITALHELEEIIWPELIESLCVIDRILRNDPDGSYARMDFETRDRYRRVIEKMAWRSRYSEPEVAGLAVELARETNSHVGRFLIGDMRPELRRAAHSSRSFTTFFVDAVLRVPLLVYTGSIAILMLAIVFAASRWLGPFPSWFLALLLIPASQAALSAVNLLVSYAVKPQLLPRLDFRNGIPDDHRTAVVVPTLLLSRDGIQRLVDNLEIYFLANRDSNLYFCLLTDFPDSRTEKCEKQDLLEFCAAGIRALNERHGSGSTQPFYLLHRTSEWNASEGKWMGRERKRGKLEDLNNLLLTGANAFSFTVGDIARLISIRYVITLDSDTQLPRDTAWKLVGSMAHPLNQPVFDEKTGLVKAGYGLLQPRVSVSMESASTSNLASIFSGHTGFDPYTRAVSDVYQDLFGRATFTGKGIYDVAAFERATRHRFPDNTLLSHDLIEGEHVRAGLVTDLEMIDDYPTKYQAWSKRKHRWVRGDWQIAMWLLPRVPNSSWRWVPNVLRLSARWKIFDNLRRSLVEIFATLALLAAWFIPRVDAVSGTLAVAAILVLPVYAELAISLIRLPPLRFVRAWAWTRAFDFGRGHLETLLTLLFLPVQSLLMTDAVVRTLYRRIISGEHLLEWESMAAAEMAKRSRVKASQLLRPAGWVAMFRSWNLPERYLAAGTGVAALCWLHLVREQSGSNPIPFALALAWVAAPLVMVWLNSGPTATSSEGADRAFLRGVSLSTWRYFKDHCSEDENWLVPDNVQEDPPARARRTSPTNIGLELNAFLAAHEFGYVTHHEFAVEALRVLGTMEKLERYNGHFYNWYDTQTLATLSPRFVSTVDSGNLAASLIVTRQAALALNGSRIVEPKILQGLLDHLYKLRDTLPVSTRTTSIVKQIEALSRLFRVEPDDLFFWEGVLSEVHALAGELRAPVEWSADRLSASAPEVAREIKYWLNAFITRAEAALRHTCELAPWLCEPFETELRLSINHPKLARLMEHLRRIPKLSDLPAVYESVSREAAALEQEERVHIRTRETLRNLRSALSAALNRCQQLHHQLEDVAAASGRFHDEMDFRFLFDRKRHLLRIGWNGDANALENSCYDLLASEARTAVFVAIAKGDAPREAWFHLGRKLTYYRGHRTLLSWSGTMFEYLMPALFMNTWSGTLLGESMRSVVRIQRLYARERRVPWGISESAHSVRDGALNYQYRAFGVPCCGMQRIPEDDLVISPYASVLSLMVDPRAAAENLRSMASRGWLARYGFYEAIDFRRQMRGYRRVEVIRAFMVHHQGMSLLALANVLLDNPVRKLFHSNPSVLATELLLQERMPVMVETHVPDQPFPQAVPGEAKEATAPGALQTVE
jgi:hypothetical protein